MSMIKEELKKNAIPLFGLAALVLYLAYLQLTSLSQGQSFFLSFLKALKSKSGPGLSFWLITVSVTSLLAGAIFWLRDSIYEKGDTEAQWITKSIGVAILLFTIVGIIIYTANSR